MPERIIVDIEQAMQRVHRDRFQALPCPDDVQHCDLFIHTDAGYAFFHVIKPHTDVIKSWHAIQDEIAAFLRRLSKEERPNEGAYLALLVEGPHNPVTLQRIASNPFVCRKVVIPTAQTGSVEELVGRLPFLPLPESVLDAVQDPPADPLQIVRGTQLSAEFARALLLNGVERVKDRLVQGEFFTEPGAEGAPDVHSVQSSATGGGRFALRRVKLKGFRNFGGEGRELRIVSRLAVIYGRNGTGKSTLCEAVEWGLTGQSYRVTRIDEGASVRQAPILSLWDAARTAEVEINLEGPHKLNIRRQLSDDGMNRWVDSQPVREPDVLERLSVLSADELLSRMDTQAQEVMSYCHFLSQETIAGFLTSTPEERYKSYQYLAGTQHLDRLSQKGHTVQRLLRQDLNRADDEVQQLEMMIRQREQKREERFQEAVTAAGGHLPNSADLGDRTRAFCDASSRVDIDLESPHLPTVAAAQSVGETFLTAHQNRLSGWQKTHNALLRLRETTQSISRSYEAVTRLKEQLQSLQAEEDMKQAAMDPILQERDTATRIAQEQEDTLAALRRALDPVEQFINIADEREEVARNIQRAESVIRELNGQRTAQDVHLTSLSAKTAEVRALLSERQVQLSGTTEQLSRLRAFSDGLSQAQNAIVERAQLITHLDSISIAVRSNEQLLKSTEATLKKAKQTTKHRGVELQKTQRLVQRKEQLLVQLRSQLSEHDRCCPFCGEDWDTPEELLAKVSNVLEELPAGLGPAQDAHDQAAAAEQELAERVEAIREDLQHGRDELEIGRQQLDSLNRLIETAELTASALLGQPLQDLDRSTLEAEIVKAVTGQHDLRKAVMDSEKTLVNLGQEMNQVTDHANQTAKAKQEVEDHLNELRFVKDQNEHRFREMPRHFVSRAAAVAERQALERETQQAENRLDRSMDRLERAESLLQTANAAVDAVRSRKPGIISQLASELERVEKYHAALAAYDILDKTVPEQREKIDSRLASTQGLMSAAQTLAADAVTLIGQAKALRLLEDVEALDGDLGELKEQMRGVQSRREWLNLCVDRVTAVLLNATALMEQESQQRLELYRPIIQLIYERLHRHPYFGELDLDIDHHNRRLLVRFKARPGQDISAAVTQYFSMAQQNAVAISIFLGTALLQAWSRLGVICLDDPVQHMDDLNIYALLDLLHMVSLSGRQVIITTSNEDLYRLMLARFAVENTQETPFFEAFRLVGVSPDSPDIKIDTPRMH